MGILGEILACFETDVVFLVIVSQIRSVLIDHIADVDVVDVTCFGAEGFPGFWSFCFVYSPLIWSLILRFSLNLLFLLFDVPRLLIA